MSGLISINYIGGSHGHFLKHLLDLVFAGRRWDKCPVTATGAWHVYYQGFALFSKANRPLSTFESAHYFKLNGRVATLSNPALSITTDSIHEMALCAIYFPRKGDSFHVSASEIIKLNREEFISMYALTLPKLKYNKVETARKNIFDEVMNSVYETTEPSEMSIIKLYARKISIHITADQEENTTFIKSSGHDVYFFRMIWLYNPVDCLRAIREISIKLNLPILVTDEEIIEVLAFFRSTIKELPNIDLAQQKFDSILTGVDETLLDLDINSKIFLCVLLQHHCPTILDQLVSWPKTTLEMAEKIDMVINTR